MKKLTLDLDKLDIHSFETGAECSARGTVAAAAGECGTLAPFCWCTAVDPGATAPAR